MSTQVFALVWSRTFAESCRPPKGSVPHSSVPPKPKLELAAGDGSLFTDRAKAQGQCDMMNADYPAFNDRPVEVVPLPVQ